jgi:capsular polysaccharide biosynthesis protein
MGVKRVLFEDFKYLQYKATVMNKKVKVSLPVNLTFEELEVFEPQLSYEAPSHKVKYIKNAFITATGLVFGNKGFIKECCHYNWGHYNSAQKTVCLAQASQFYHDAQNDPQNLFIFDDDETYLLIHHPWYRNYYHWLSETLCRAWMVKDMCDQMILLLPPQDTLSKFALDSLQLFNFKKIIHIPAGKSALVRKLCMPAQRPILDCYNPKILLEVNKLFVNYVKSQTAVHTSVYERIYVSRKNATRRKIINEEDVIAALTKYNFTVFRAEDYTFLEQVSFFSNAKYVAGIHGAGLANMLFMPPGSTVFELIKRRTNPKRHFNLLLWYMADALGHKYYCQNSEPTDINELFVFADIVVDIKLLNKNLELMFSN